MAAAVNKVILVGHLGRDPEVRYTPDGKAICNFTMATTDSWKDKASGEKRERTEWHRIVVFGRLAEICGEYLSKGRQVYVEGALKTRKWTDKEGVERYTTEVVIDMKGTMQMLGSREGGGGGAPAGGGRHTQGRSAGSAPDLGDYNSPPAYPDGDDDIPF